MNPSMLSALTGILLSLSSILSSAAPVKTIPTTPSKPILFGGPISQNLWVLSGTQLQPAVASWTIGGTVVPTGNVDYGGFNLADAGAVTAVTFAATSTTASSTFTAISASGSLLVSGSLAVTGNLAVNGSAVALIQTGTSASIGGGLLTVATCATGDATGFTSLSSTTVAIVEPRTYPGDGFFVDSFVANATTVTVRVCSSATLTPTATTYNVRTIQ